MKRELTWPEMLAAMQEAQKDLPKPRVLWKTANPVKVSICWFKRRMLRGEIRHFVRK